MAQYITAEHTKVKPQASVAATHAYIHKERGLSKLHDAIGANGYPITQARVMRIGSKTSASRRNM